MPPNQQNKQQPGQYDFIMNPEKPPKKPLFVSTGSTGQKIIVVAVGLVLLIMLMVIVSSFLNKSANAQNDKLLGLAKTQTEIARVADAAKDKITDKNLLYESINVKLSVESSKQEIVSALASRGKKVKEKNLQVINPDNDTVLAQGEQNGRFDDTYKQLLEQQLIDYQKQLQTVYDSSNATEKDIVSSANDQISLLLGKPSQ